MKPLQRSSTLLFCLAALTACNSSSTPSDPFPSRLTFAVVRGVVVDESGAAVEGARVSAVIESNVAPTACSGNPSTVDTLTSQSGEYRFLLRSRGPQYDACVTVTATPPPQSQLQPETAPVGHVTFTSEYGGAEPDELVVNVSLRR